LGDMTPAQLIAVLGVLTTFMSEIRQIREQAPCAAHGSGPTCESCAFEPTKDSEKGFAPTAYGLLWAICNRKLFVCHANQPTWEDNLLDTSKGVVLCNGFKQVKDEDRAHVVATKAMEAIREIVPFKETQDADRSSTTK
jgi:hypothetical protein